MASFRAYLGRTLLVLLEDQIHSRGINLHILTGICAGIHRPDGATIAHKMLFMIAAMTTEIECELIREHALDGLRAAEARGRRGGRPPPSTTTSWPSPVSRPVGHDAVVGR